MTLPLIAVLLSITFYLLPLWKPSGELLCGCFRHSLPHATQTAPLEVGVVIDVRGREVFLDGMPEDTDEHLSDDLHTLHDNYLLLHPGDDFVGRFLLMADKDVPFGHISRLVRVAKNAGFGPPDYVVEVDE